MSVSCAGNRPASGSALRAAISICASILLAACGGGGGSSTSISVTPASLAFTATPESGSQTANVAVTFQGDGVIVGFPPGVEVPSWISVAELGAGTAGAAFAVTADPQYQVPGEYSTTLRFLTARVSSSGNVSGIKYDDVQVTLAVVALDLSPAAVSLQAVDGAGTILTGALTLAIADGQAWTVQDNQPWLTVEPSGTGSGAVDYTVNASGLGVGDHTATVTVTGPGDLTDSATITLTTRAPRLTANPAAPSFTITTDNASATLEQALHIADELDGADASRAASWTLQTTGAAWLAMTPASGSSAPGADVTLSLVESQLAQMPNGSYTANVLLAYTDGAGAQRSLAVPVTLDLDSPLQSISVTPATLERVVAQQPAQFTATGTYATGYSGDVTSQVTWTSSSVAADVGNGGALASGLSRPLAPGVATITAAMPGSAVSGAATFTVSPVLGYAYYGAYYASELFQFVFGTSGELEPLWQHASIPTGGAVGTTLITPSGNYAYLVTGSGIRQYTVNAGGYLEPMATVLVPASANTGLITVDPTEQHLYALAYEPATSQYKIRHYGIGSDGSLSLVSASAPGVPNAWAIDVLSTGGYLYVTDSSQITSYAIAADGELTKLGTTSPAREDLALHPSGGAAYAITQWDVRQYTVGADGSLTPMSPAAVELGTGNMIGSRIVVDSAGKHAYALDSYQQRIRHYTIGADLKLTVSGTDATGVPYTPLEMVIEPSGKYLYVIGNGAPAKFTIGEDGAIVGAPTYMSSPAFTRGFAVRAGPQ